MDFTGERYVPTESGEIRHEHMHRYGWASQVLAGLDVLDIASGEGYGSALLARSAARVVGVDISAEAIAHANERYAGLSNLSFVVGSAAEIPLATDSVDAVVSFETIEHHAQHEEMLAEIDRVLRPGGFLIISSPNKEVYSDKAGYHNEFHVKELYFEELDRLLKSRFQTVTYFGQRLAVGSALTVMDAKRPPQGYQGISDTGDTLEFRSAVLAEPVYFIAIAARERKYLPAMPPSVFFSEAEDLYLHHKDVARWAQRLDREHDELKLHFQRMRAERDSLQETGAWLQGELQNKEEQRANLELAQAELQELIKNLEQELTSSKARVEKRDSELKQERALTRQLKAKAEERDARMREMRSQLDLIYASHSWRITRPLRFLSRIVRGDWEAVAGSLRRVLGSRGSNVAIEVSTAQGESVPAEVNLEGLSFPPAAHPVVTVIIPTYGKLDYTAACLKSISRHLPDMEIEVLVIEDASADTEIDRLAEVPGLRYERNAENLGFLRSCNRAAGLARGDYICFLNNDTEVKEGWLDAMLEVFSEREDCGMVGAKLIFSDGKLQEAGGIIWNDASGWNYGRGSDPEAPEFNYVREADYCSGAAVLIRRAFFDEIGRFDEAYAPAYCEDSDLAFQVRRAGKKVYYTPFAEVVHHEGVSHGTDVNAGIKAYQKVNQEKFRERWKSVLAEEHYPNGEMLLRARDRARSKRTILIVDHYVPQPDKDAGSRTMMAFIECLISLGCNVKFWPDNRYRDPVYTPKLQKMGVEVVYGHRSMPDYEAYIGQFGEQLDCVLLSRPNIAGPYIRPTRTHSNARIVYYGHDLHFIRLRRQIEVDGETALESAAEECEQLERAIWKGVDKVLYPSQEEANLVIQLEPSVSAERILPYAFRETGPKGRINPAERRGILFVAGFSHPPNVDAAKWLVEAIMPRVWAQAPDTILTLVGSNPTEEVVALKSDRVVVTGYISDSELEQHYLTARIAVVPVRFGAGVKGKVVEALKWGLPLVTTPVGAEGIRDIEGVAEISASAAEFAERIIDLMRDDARWNELSHRATQLAHRSFSFKALEEHIRRVVEA